MFLQQGPTSYVMFETYIATTLDVLLYSDTSAEGISKVLCNTIIFYIQQTLVAIATLGIIQSNDSGSQCLGILFLHQCMHTGNK